MVKKYRDHVKRVENFYCFLQEALSMGYVPVYDHRWGVLNEFADHIDIYVSNLKDFSKIHKLVGKLENNGMTPKKQDGRCREVTVTLKPKDEAFSFLRFQFDRKLPKGGKCKLVTTKYNSTRVVCNI